MREIYYALNPWWENKEFECGVPRDKYLCMLEPAFKRKQIEIILGGRRVGKTTILKQLVKMAFNKGFAPFEVFYLTLDHPRFSDCSILEHLKNFRKFHLHGRDKKILVFLDEIQENRYWEKELKTVYDLENVKFFCTGSTSYLLESQGGKLTGRQILTTVYPLDFNESLLFKQARLSLSEEYKYEKLVEDYLITGGYPESILMPGKEYLQNLLDDVIARYIVKLFQIRKVYLLKDLLQLISASVGSRISYNKLANVLKISVDTIKEYVSCFETTFMVKSVEKWSHSYNEKIYNAKKLYLLDTGIKTVLTGDEDFGAKAENVVFLHFLRNKIDCGYFAESEREVDFVIGGYKKYLPVEVKYQSSIDWADRKFSGMKLFLKRYPKTSKALVISKDKEAEFKENGVVIKVMPLWKFLLSNPKELLADLGV